MRKRRNTLTAAGSASTRSFATCVLLSASTFSQAYSRLMLQDIESTHNIRRYLALRTCTPNLRKTSKPTKSKASDASTSESPEDVRGLPLPPIGSGSKGGTILKEGREIAGFVLAESEVRREPVLSC